MTRKIDVANEAIDLATKTAAISDRCAALLDVYFDNGFESGGNAIVDGDIAVTGITAAQLGGFINFCTALGNLLNNTAPTTADWDSTLNQIRKIEHL